MITTGTVGCKLMLAGHIEACLPNLPASATGHLITKLELQKQRNPWTI